MFRPLFWAIVRSQMNLRKLYSVIYKIIRDLSLLNTLPVKINISITVVQYLF